MKDLRRLLSRFKNAVFRTPVPTKPQGAAAFFIENFARLSPAEMDALVARYWQQFRRFAEVLALTGMSTTDEELRLLDIGGGYSSGLRLFETPYRWVLDICVDELYRAGMSMPRDIRFICGQGERIPFPDHFFDAVFCTNVLDHVEHPALVLQEVRRSLKPSGHMVLMVDLFDEGAEHDEHDVLHPHTLHAESIEELLNSEFHIERRTTQSTDGKVGLAMLARGVIEPHRDRQEHIFVLRPREA